MLQNLIYPFRKKQGSNQIKRKMAIRNKQLLSQKNNKGSKTGSHHNQCRLRGQIEQTKAKVPSKPAIVSCDICKLEHEHQPLVYNPSHKSFYCFECYYSWKQHQSFLEKLEYSKSADSFFDANANVKKPIISDKDIDEMIIETDQLKQRREHFKKQLSKWQSYVQKM